MAKPLNPGNVGYAFNTPAVAEGDNRVNTSGQASKSIINKTSLRIANILQAANAPVNNSLIITVPGTQFYFRVATGNILVRPRGGVFSAYGQGEGLNLARENAFAQLELKNPNNFPVVFELFIGFDGFIDNKLILAQSVFPNVPFPTNPTIAATNVNINDLSGTGFTDINGGKWYAIFRVAIVISNTDGGVTLFLQKKGSIVANGPSIAAIFPLTSIRLDASGDYALNTGGGVINALVSEIYSAIPQ